MTQIINNYKLTSQTKNYITKLEKFIGTKINNLFILDLYYNQQYSREYRYQFKCQCVCGEIIYKSANSILRGLTKSCGNDCSFKHLEEHRHKIGIKIHNLTILDIFYDKSKPSNSRIYYKCKCDCGEICNIKYQDIIALKRPIKSCGCKFEYWNNILNKLDLILKTNNISIIDDYNGVMENTNNNVGFKYKIYKFKCNVCNTVFSKTLNNTNNKNFLCPNCFPIKSSIENDVKIWLGQFSNIITNSQIKSKCDIQSRIEIDFIIDKIGVEMHGLVTHATTYYDYNNHFIGHKPKNYHLNKTISCEEQGIDLLQFWNTEWIQKQDIVKSIILNRLGKTPYREYARNCAVKEIDKKSYNDFMNKNHIQGSTIGESVRLGLFYKHNNNLVSVMSFGSSRYDIYQWEMFRFCNCVYSTVIGAASKLFKYFLRNYNPSSIVSYSDRRLFNNGKLYMTLGFTLSHMSVPCYWYFKKKSTDYSHELYHRSTFMKHKLKDKLEIFDPSLTEWENMENNGYLRVYDCGNKIYNWFKEE